MSRTLIAWILAFFITLAAAYFQRVTGPTYPLAGTAVLQGKGIPYRLPRSHGGETHAVVAIDVPDTLVTGTLSWRRYRTADAWTRAPMRREGEMLRAEIPHQIPAAKLEYTLTLSRGADSVSVPAGSTAVIRFKGDVPTVILVAHIVLMFAGMLLSTRTGLTWFTGGEGSARLTGATITLLFAGGMILGPVVQKYAFGAFWTGWPLGSDLTDNKTAAALAAWFAAALVRRRVHRPHLWALVAAIITIAVYLIPHSLLGSAVTPPPVS